MNIDSLVSANCQVDVKCRDHRTRQSNSRSRNGTCVDTGERKRLHNLPIRPLRCAGYCVPSAPGGNWPVMHVIFSNRSDASGPLRADILKRQRGIVRVLTNGSGHRQVFASYARIKDQRCSEMENKIEENSINLAIQPSVMLLCQRVGFKMSRQNRSIILE